MPFCHIFKSHKMHRVNNSKVQSVSTEFFTDFLKNLNTTIGYKIPKSNEC